MKCILKKIFRPEELEGGLRTETVEGNTLAPPQIGKSFEVIAKSFLEISEGFIGCRKVNTSPIVNMVLINDGYRVTTMSGSIYEILIYNFDDQEVT